MEIEIRELLSKYDYNADYSKFVKGSASAAMNETDAEVGEKKVLIFINRF